MLFLQQPKKTRFTITDTKLYAPIVTLSTQDNAKPLQKLKSGFKRTIDWNKYKSKVTIQEPNTYLDYLIDPSFPGVNRNFFDQLVKNNLKTYDNMPITATGQGDDYTTSCLLDYNYFNKYYKTIVIDLSKQQTLGADPKAIQQINFEKKSSPRNVFHY